MSYIPKSLSVNGKEYNIVKLLGKGKGGYSYLVMYPANTNIDYFSTNFVVQDGLIYYIDYECNDYMDEWNFENWGIKYW